MTRIPFSAAACALAAGLAFMAAPSSGEAANSRSLYVAATSVCNVVDPSQADQLRFRHLGIFNMPQGSSVQIACSVLGDYEANTDDGWVRIEARNFRSGPTSMNCAVSGGKRAYGVNNYPKTIYLPANGVGSTLWENIDRMDAYGHYNIVCILPPNVELSTIWFGQYDDGGMI